jgi:hypothetical protein
MVRAHPCFECSFGSEAFNLFWVGNNWCQGSPPGRYGAYAFAVSFAGRRTRSGTSSRTTLELKST